MHKIYEIGGEYDIIYFLPKIIISFIASYYLTIIIKLIFLSERNITKVRKQVSLSLAYSISDKVKKNLVIKYIIFFISGLIFLVFFGCYCPHLELSIQILKCLFLKIL